MNPLNEANTSGALAFEYLSIWAPTLRSKRTTQFNAQDTRWLGVWLDPQLALKEHHKVRMKKAGNAQNRLRTLAGQVGLSPENSRQVQSSFVQAAALFGAELWWKGDNAQGMVGRRESVQKLVNQEARLTTGAFRTTNQGALSLESGFRPAVAQLANRLRRFALRLASLPKGEQARELVGASDSALGQRLQSALGCWNGRGDTVLLEVAYPWAHSPRSRKRPQWRWTRSSSTDPA